MAISSSPQFRAFFSWLMPFVIEFDGSVFQLTRTVIKLACAILELCGAILRLGDAVIKLACSVIQLTGSLIQLYSACMQSARSGVEDGKRRRASGRYQRSDRSCRCVTSDAPLLNTVTPLISSR